MSLVSVALAGASVALAQNHGHGGPGGGGWGHGGGAMHGSAPGWSHAGGPGMHGGAPGWSRSGPAFRPGPPSWTRGGPPARGPTTAWSRGSSQGGGGYYDARRNNGYWLGPRWYYGAPAAPVVREPGYRPGYAPFRPGGYLPQQYQAFDVDEYWRFHLRRPPYGFHWVQAGDEFLLVSIATGQIFDVVADQ